MFREGKIAWHTAEHPSQMFLDKNTNPRCQHCFRNMRKFAMPEKSVCHLVCANYRQVDYAATIEGRKHPNCGDVHEDAKGLVFGCEECLNDMGPIGAKGCAREKLKSGVGRSHVYCLPCIEFARRGIAGSSALLPAGTSMNSLTGDGAQRGIAVVQVASPAISKKAGEEAEWYARASMELTTEELRLRQARNPKIKSMQDIGRHARSPRVFNQRFGDLVHGLADKTPEEPFRILVAAHGPNPAAENLRAQHTIVDDGGEG
jgi:hypothetical protein